MEGLNEVVHTASLESVAEKISLLLDAEIERMNNSWQIHKQRVVRNQKNIFCMMNINVEVNAFEENGTAVNKASVFLLPEELHCFTMALLQHPIPFPTHFSQSQTTNSHLFCLHLETKELPENFIERLAGALHAIS